MVSRGNPLSVKGSKALALVVPPIAEGMRILKGSSFLLPSTGVEITNFTGAGGWGVSGEGSCSQQSQPEG